MLNRNAMTLAATHLPGHRPQLCPLHCKAWPCVEQGVELIRQHRHADVILRAREDRVASDAVRGGRACPRCEPCVAAGSRGILTATGRAAMVAAAEAGAAADALAERQQVLAACEAQCRSVPPQGGR